MGRRFQQWSGYAFMLIALGAAFLLLVVSVVFRFGIEHFIINTLGYGDFPILKLASTGMVFIAIAFFAMWRWWFSV